MKKLLLIILFVVLVLAMGCSSGIKIPNRFLSQQQEDEIFTWNDKDFDAVVKRSNAESAEKFSITIPNSAVMKIPYYKHHYGEPYSSYTVYTYYSKAHQRIIDYSHDFHDFRNWFVHPEKFSIAKAAKTYNQEGQLVAEAELLGFTENTYRNETQRGFEIQEFHYGPEGRVIFVCKSQYDNLGIKKSETEREGEKEKD